MNRADIAAAIASMSEVDTDSITLVASSPEGDLYIGTTPTGANMATIVRPLAATAPPRARWGYRCCVIATFAGRCELCEDVATVTSKTKALPSGIGHQTLIQAAVDHKPECPASAESLARWIR